MRHTRLLHIVTSAAAVAITVAACGGGTAASGSAGTATDQQALGDHALMAPRSALTATVSATLGTIVVDAGGRTLYRSDKDTASPSVSHCAGACARMWPPVLAGAADVQLQGVDFSEVGTITRQDGGRQFTIAGWPLYEFANDAGPGDHRGQGVDGTWFAVTPVGGRAVATGGAATTTESLGGGY
jgi:predicted lipoprotein with Yx(FWY)xxD motif